MEWTIREEGAPKFLAMRVRGRFTMDECRRGIAELAAKKDPFMPLLFDDREVDFTSISDFDLLEMASLLGRYADKFGYSRMAILVSSEKDRTLADRWRRIVSTGGSDGIAVFENETDASRWLFEESS